MAGALPDTGPSAGTARAAAAGTVAATGRRGGL